MGLRSRLLKKNRRSNSGLVAVRMSKNDHHYYSILASDSGFEFVFQNGQDRWSTISASLASRIISGNQEGKIGTRIASNQSEFLKLAIGNTESGTSSWVSSEEIYYPSRESALLAERKILDLSWQNAEEKLSDE